MTSIEPTVKNFGLLCRQVADEPSLTLKKDIISGFTRRYAGDLTLLFSLLLPKLSSRVYYVQEKQILSLLSDVLEVRESTLKDEWNRNGCVADTALLHFTPSSATPRDGHGWCNMLLSSFDGFLDKFSSSSTHTERCRTLKSFCSIACPQALYYFLREIKQDLRLNAGERTIFEGLHPQAYDIYKHCARISEVVRVVQRGIIGDTDERGSDRSPSAGDDSSTAGGTRLGQSMQLGIPISPMLAAPVRSIQEALRKCPNGAFSEVKYDGERIQVHKNGAQLHFFSRSLKPMKPEKYSSIEMHLQQAITADSCILDGEILMVDQVTSIPLPFGTLGSHKRENFAAACPCIFFFDILYINGASATNLPLKKRRELLKSSVQFVRNRVMFSELCIIEGDQRAREKTLQKHLNIALCEGLEGLVIKDVMSVYEPRARHWMKIKKDYLDGLADLADLLVVGAWYGSGSKGGQLMTFLMGCVDTTVPLGADHCIKTVCKVTNGLSDSVITVLTKRYKETMTPTTSNGSKKSLPKWLDCSSIHVPDMIVKDYRTADIMMIIGAEFTASSNHSSGISIRFPRVLRLRPDKSLDTATTLSELQCLFHSSPALTQESEEESKILRLEDATANLSDYVPSGSSGGKSLEAGDEYLSSVPVKEKSFVKKISGRPEKKRSSITYRNNVAALPLDNHVEANESVLVCHCVAERRHWSSKGFMGRISLFFGSSAQQEFDKCVGTRDGSFSCSALCLGDVCLSEVGSASRPGRVFIATMIVQEISSHGKLPIVNEAALHQALDTCLRLGEQSSVSTFIIAKPPLYSQAGSSFTPVYPTSSWNELERWWKTVSPMRGVSFFVCPSYDPNFQRAQPTSSIQRVDEKYRDTFSQSSVNCKSAPSHSINSRQLRLEEVFRLQHPSDCNNEEERTEIATPFAPRCPRDLAPPIERDENTENRSESSDTDEDEFDEEISELVTECNPRVEASEERNHQILCGVSAVIATEELNEEIELLLHLMGGRLIAWGKLACILNDLNSLPWTHLIVPSACLKTRRLVSSLALSVNQHVVSDLWVYRCFQEHHRLDEGLFHPLISSTLSEYCLLFVRGLTDSQAWRSMAELLGATIHFEWKMIGDSTTYCIADEWCDECQMIFDLGGFVVRTQWLVDSAVAKKALPPHRYCLTPKKMEKGDGERLCCCFAGADEETSKILFNIPICVLPDAFPNKSLREHLETIVRLLGAVAVTDMSEAQYCVCTLNSFRTMYSCSPLSEKLKLINFQWILECFRLKMAQEPRPFLFVDDNCNVAADWKSSSSSCILASSDSASTVTADGEPEWN